ncbi:uncharacterized protein MONOS_9351 [Monocercomonoides exilis]|uniref:uncharacterized protein n=1 Tax=Monocercomonoides exilis TaxID=2049356 RepID=UPI00355A064F|nr:hypothetical protein MONOS_9351 [Monocercomonoides exilis]|eukprot:MONOS_9351.1-p1 / transcript=MONOS_9351.1 / gene=MONOS_9351 / organism=Monocercomonoides_exilis_PA203 / gene_product=unspecified product / transcript_product=unspecified product / location=Mono_scaffold00383:5212-24314(+) / protein_length=6312 / sequence_SO=supercontig / SO=protein_coding / is_pseudo=false
MNDSSKISKNTTRQAIIILCGDSIVTPEVLRAIDCGLKPRYKQISLDKLILDNTQDNAQVDDQLRMHMDSTNNKSNSEIVFLITNFVRNEFRKLLQPTKDAITGDNNSSNIQSARNSVEMRSIPNKNSEISKKKGKQDISSKTKSKSGEEKARQSVNLEEELHPAVPSDPDDSPNIPFFPKQFLVFSGLPDQLAFLIELQKSLLTIGHRIDAVVQIRPVPYVPQPFLTAILQSTTQVLFPPALFPIKAEADTSNEKQNEKTKGKAKGGSEKEKEKEKSKTGKKAAEAASDSTATAVQYSMTPLASTLINAPKLHPSTGSANVLDEIGCLTPLLPSSSAASCNFSLFDQLMLVRALLVDAPGAVFHDIFLLEVLGGSPFFPSRHLLPLTSQNTPQTPGFSIPPPPVPIGALKKGSSFSLMPQPSPLASSSSTATLQVPSLLSSSSSSSSLSPDDSSPLSSSSSSLTADRPDALSVVCGVTPTINPLPGAPFQMQSANNAQRSSLLAPLLSQHLLRPPPPLVPSSDPVTQPFSTLTPFNPSSSSSDSFPLMTAPANPSQPLPFANLFSPPTLLFVPKDGVTLLREIHLPLCAFATRYALYQQWLTDMPRTEVPDGAPYELMMAADSTQTENAIANANASNAKNEVKEANENAATNTTEEKSGQLSSSSSSQKLIKPPPLQLKLLQQPNFSSASTTRIASIPQTLRLSQQEQQWRATAFLHHRLTIMSLTQTLSLPSPAAANGGEEEGNAIESGKVGKGEKGEKGEKGRMAGKESEREKEKTKEGQKASERKGKKKKNSKKGEKNETEDSETEQNDKDNTSRSTDEAGDVDAFNTEMDLSVDSAAVQVKVKELKEMMRSDMAAEVLQMERDKRASEESQLDGSLSLDLRRYKRTANKFTVMLSGEQMKEREREREGRKEKKDSDVIPIIPRPAANGWEQWFQPHAKGASTLPFALSTTTASSSSSSSSVTSRYPTRNSPQPATFLPFTDRLTASIAKPSPKSTRTLSIQSNQNIHSYLMDVGLSPSLVLHSVVDQICFEMSPDGEKVRGITRSRQKKKRDGNANTSSFSSSLSHFSTTTTVMEENSTTTTTTSPQPQPLQPLPPSSFPNRRIDPLEEQSMEDGNRTLEREMDAAFTGIIKGKQKQTQQSTPKQIKSPRLQAVTLNQMQMNENSSSSSSSTSSSSSSSSQPSSFQTKEAKHTALSLIQSSPNFKQFLTSPPHLSSSSSSSSSSSPTPFSSDAHPQQTISIHPVLKSSIFPSSSSSSSYSSSSSSKSPNSIHTLAHSPTAAVMPVLLHSVSSLTSSTSALSPFVTDQHPQPSSPPLLTSSSRPFVQKSQNSSFGWNHYTTSGATSNASTPSNSSSSSVGNSFGMLSSSSSSVNSGTPRRSAVPVQSWQTSSQQHSSAPLSSIPSPTHSPSPSISSSSSFFSSSSSSSSASFSKLASSAPFALLSALSFFHNNNRSSTFLPSSTCCVSYLSRQLSISPSLFALSSNTATNSFSSLLAPSSHPHTPSGTAGSSSPLSPLSFAPRSPLLFTLQKSLELPSLLHTLIPQPLTNAESVALSLSFIHPPSPALQTLQRTQSPSYPYSCSSSTSSSSSSTCPSTSLTPPPNFADSPSSFTPSEQSNSPNSPSAFLSSLSAHKSLSVRAAASPLRRSADSYSESGLHPIPPTPSDRIEGIDGAVAVLETLSEVDEARSPGFKTRTQQFDYQYEKITTLATLSAEDSHYNADGASYSSSSAFMTSQSHASKPIRAPTFSSQQIQNLCGISNSSPNTGAYAAVSATTALPLSVLLSSPTICQSALFPLLSPLTKDIELLITPILSFASQQKESRADKTAKQHGMNTTNSSQLPSQLLSSAGWMLSGDRIRKISEADSAAPSSLMQTMMDEGIITSGPQKAMTSLAQKRLAGKSSALGYPQSASSSSALLAPVMPTSPSSSSSSSSSFASSSSSLPPTTMYLPPSSPNALLPSFYSTFISQHHSISSVRDALLLLSDAVKQASFEHRIISAAQKRSFPASILPPDMLSLLDTEGDFAESKDFFSTVDEGELKRAIGNEDSLLLALLCMSFSEMLACDSDANGCDFVCSHNVCGGRHFHTDTPLFSQSSNSPQTNKNQTGNNNSSSSEMSINPFADPSNEIIVPSEQQRQLQGTVGGFLFVADKNGMDGFRKAAVVSTQQANDQRGMGMMGGVSAAAATGLSTMGIGMSSFSVMATQSQAALASTRDTQQSVCVLPQTGRQSSSAPLPLSNVPPAMTVSSFPRGVRWDGDGCSEQITLIDNLVALDGTRRRKANQSQNSSTSGTGNERLHSRSNSTATPFSVMMKRSGLGAEAMERDMLCANLRALFSAPVVDPSVYTVVEELPPFELNQLLLHLCLFDPPIRTRAFLPEDSLLVAIGSVGLDENCLSSVGDVPSSDCFHWLHRFGAVPSFGEWDEQYTDNISRIYIPQTAVSAAPPAQFFVNATSTSSSSSSSSTTTTASSTGVAPSRSTSTAKLTNTSSDSTPPLLHSSSTLSVPFVRAATFVTHPNTSTKPPSSSSEENYTSGISLRPLPTTTQLSPYSSSSFAKHSAFNASHPTSLLPLHPPLVDFGRPFVVEQFTSFATPRQQVTVKASLERCGQSMEARITAMHRRGHVFSMARRCVFRMASAASSDGRVASAGMSAAAVASFVSALSEILEGVPVGGMNVAYGSALKACSSASPPISKAAFNSDDDESDDDTLLGDKASSDEGRLSVPASTRSSLSISSTSPLRSSSSSASISPLSSSTNSLALSKDSSIQSSITLSPVSTIPFSPFSSFSPLVLSLLDTLFTSPSVDLALSFCQLAQQAADFISQRISQFVVTGGAKERLAISSGSGSSSTSEAAAGMRGGKRDDGKSSDYGDDDEDDESADDLATKTRADLPDDPIKSGFVSQQLSPAVILPRVQLNDLEVQLKRMLKMPLQTLFVSTTRRPLLPRGWMGSAVAALAMGQLQQTMFREQMTGSVDYADRRTHSPSLPLSLLAPHKEQNSVSSLSAVQQKSDAVSLSAVAELSSSSVPIPPPLTSADSSTQSTPSLSLMVPSVSPSVSPSPPPPQQPSLSSSVNQLAKQLLNPSNLSATNPISNANQPVGLDFIATPTHISTFSDKTAASMRFLPKQLTQSSVSSTANLTNQTQNPFEVTYSTVSGLVVSVNSVDGTIRMTHAPTSGEGNYLFGRGKGELLMANEDEYPTQKLIAEREEECRRLVENAVCEAEAKAEEGIRMFRKGEVVQGMRKEVEVEVVPEEVVAETNAHQKKKDGAKEEKKKGNEKEKGKMTEKEKAAEKKANKNKNEVVEEQAPSEEETNAAVDPSTITEQEAEVFRRCYTRSLFESLASTGFETCFVPSSKKSNGITQQTSSSSSSSSSHSPNNPMHREWGAVCPSHCYTTLTREPRYSPSQTSPPHEVERIVSGMGTSIVRLSNGAAAVLLANGDLSACNGDEWVSVGRDGSRVSRPLFKFPLIDRTKDIVQKCFGSGDENVEEVPVESEGLPKWVRECSQMSAEHTEKEEAEKEAQIEDDSNQKTDDANENSNQTQKKQTDPLGTPQKQNQSSMKTSDMALKGYIETKPEPLNANLSNTSLPSNRPNLCRLSLPPQFPCSQQLPPIASVTSTEAELSAEITTRADRVTIIQHKTGERLVHHADGTRVFHSFSFSMNPEAISAYEAETGSKAPMKAIICIEHPNAARVLIYLVQKKFASIVGGQKGASTSSSSSSSSSQSSSSASEVASSPSLSPLSTTSSTTQSPSSSSSFSSSSSSSLLTPAPQLSDVWVRDRVVVVLPDGAAMEWLANEHKIVLSKPHNTHVHYASSGCVSVFVENTNKRIPPTAGLTGRLPLLFFNTNEGTLAVRPSKHSLPINPSSSNADRPITSAKRNPPSTPSAAASSALSQVSSTQSSSSSSSSTANAANRRSFGRRVFITSFEGISQWAVAKNMRSATISRHIPGAFLPALFGQASDLLGASPSMLAASFGTQSALNGVNAAAMLASMPTTASGSYPSSGLRSSFAASSISSSSSSSNASSAFGAISSISDLPMTSPSSCNTDSVLSNCSFAESIMSHPSIEDRDTLEWMEKVVKEMKQTKEQLEADLLEHARKLKRKSMQLARMTKMNASSTMSTMSSLATSETASTHIPAPSSSSASSALSSSSSPLSSSSGTATGTSSANGSGTPLSPRNASPDATPSGMHIDSDTSTMRLSAEEMFEMGQRGRQRGSVDGAVSLRGSEDGSYTEEVIPFARQRWVARLAALSLHQMEEVAALMRDSRISFGDDASSSAASSSLSGGGMMNTPSSQPPLLSPNSSQQPSAQNSSRKTPKRPMPRLFVIRSDRSGFELLPRSAVSKLYPRSNDPVQSDFTRPIVTLPPLITQSTLNNFNHQEGDGGAATPTGSSSSSSSSSMSFSSPPSPALASSSHNPSDTNAGSSSTASFTSSSSSASISSTTTATTTNTSSSSSSSPKTLSDVDVAAFDIISSVVTDLTPQTSSQSVQSSSSSSTSSSSSLSPLSSTANISSLRQSQVNEIVRRLSQPLPALSGHSALGLPVALQHFSSSSLPSSFVAAAAGQDLSSAVSLLNGNQTNGEFSSFAPSTNQQLSSSASQQHISTQTSSQSSSSLPHWLSSVVFVPSSSSFLPASIVSPARLPPELLCTADPHRMPFAQFYQQHAHPSKVKVVEQKTAADGENSQNEKDGDKSAAYTPSSLRARHFRTASAYKSPKGSPTRSPTRTPTTLHISRQQEKSRGEETARSPQPIQGLSSPTRSSETAGKTASSLLDSHSTRTKRLHQSAFAITPYPNPPPALTICTPLIRPVSTSSFTSSSSSSSSEHSRHSAKRRSAMVSSATSPLLPPVEAMAEEQSSSTTDSISPSSASSSSSSTINPSPLLSGIPEEINSPMPSSSSSILPPSAAILHTTIVPCTCPPNSLRCTCHPVSITGRSQPFITSASYQSSTLSRISSMQSPTGYNQYTHSASDNLLSSIPSPIASASPSTAFPTSPSLSSPSPADRQIPVSSSPLSDNTYLFSQPQCTSLRPLWTPYHPDLLRFEPRNLRKTFLPSYLDQMGITRTDMQSIIDGMAPIPHPPIVSTAHCDDTHSHSHSSSSSSSSCFTAESGISTSNQSSPIHSPKSSLSSSLQSSPQSQSDPSAQTSQLQMTLEQLLQSVETPSMTSSGSPHSSNRASINMTNASSSSSSQFSSTASIAFTRQLIEHPAPPPLLLLFLFEYLSASTFILSARADKLYSKLNVGLHRAVETAWSTFVRSVDWIVQACAHTRLKGTVQQQVIAVVKAMLNGDVKKNLEKSKEPNEKENANDNRSDKKGDKEKAEEPKRKGRFSSLLSSSKDGSLGGQSNILQTGSGTSSSSASSYDLSQLISQLPSLHLSSNSIRNDPYFVEAMLTLVRTDPVLRRVEEAIQAQEYSAAQLVSGKFRANCVVGNPSSMSPQLTRSPLSQTSHLLLPASAGVASLMSSTNCSASFYPSFSLLFPSFNASIATLPSAFASRAISRFGKWRGWSGFGGWRGAVHLPTGAPMPSSQQGKTAGEKQMIRFVSSLHRERAECVAQTQRLLSLPEVGGVSSAYNGAILECSIATAAASNGLFIDGYGLLNDALTQNQRAVLLSQQNDLALFPRQVITTQNAEGAAGSKRHSRSSTVAKVYGTSGALKKPQSSFKLNAPAQNQAHSTASEGSSSDGCEKGEDKKRSDESTSRIQIEEWMEMQRKEEILYERPEPGKKLNYFESAEGIDALANDTASIGSQRSATYAMSSASNTHRFVLPPFETQPGSATAKQRSNQNGNGRTSSATSARSASQEPSTSPSPAPSATSSNGMTGGTSQTRGASFSVVERAKMEIALQQVPSPNVTIDDAAFTSTERKRQRNAKSASPTAFNRLSVRQLQRSFSGEGDAVDLSSQNASSSSSRKEIPRLPMLHFLNRSEQSTSLTMREAPLFSTTSRAGESSYNQPATERLRGGIQTTRRAATNLGFYSVQPKISSPSVTLPAALNATAATGMKHGVTPLNFDVLRKRENGSEGDRTNNGLPSAAVTSDGRRVSSQMMETIGRLQRAVCVSPSKAARIAQLMESSPAAPVHPPSVHVNAVGEPRRSPVVVKEFSKTKAPSEVNVAQLMTTGLVERETKTSSVGLARMKGMPMKDFEIIPDSLNFGTISSLGKYQMTFVVKNIGVDSSRFTYTLFPAKGSCFRVKGVPSLVAPGVTYQLAVECDGSMAQTMLALKNEPAAAHPGISSATVEQVNDEHNGAAISVSDVLKVQTPLSIISLSLRAIIVEDVSPASLRLSPSVKFVSTVGEQSHAQTTDQSNATQQATIQK